MINNKRFKHNHHVGPTNLLEYPINLQQEGGDDRCYLTTGGGEMDARRQGKTQRTFRGRLKAL